VAEPRGADGRGGEGSIDVAEKDGEVSTHSVRGDDIGDSVVVEVSYSRGIGVLACAGIGGLQELEGGYGGAQRGGTQDVVRIGGIQERHDSSGRFGLGAISDDSGTKRVAACVSAGCGRACQLAGCGKGRDFGRTGRDGERSGSGGAGCGSGGANEDSLDAVGAGAEDELDHGGSGGGELGGTEAVDVGAVGDGGVAEVDRARGYGVSAGGDGGGEGDGGVLGDGGDGGAPVVMARVVVVAWARGAAAASVARVATVARTATWRRMREMDLRGVRDWAGAHIAGSSPFAGEASGWSGG
jgi:hypothetical protein